MYYTAPNPTTNIYENRYTKKEILQPGQRRNEDTKKTRPSPSIAISTPSYSPVANNPTPTTKPTLTLLLRPVPLTIARRRSTIASREPRSRRRKIRRVCRNGRRESRAGSDGDGGEGRGGFRRWRRSSVAFGATTDAAAGRERQVGCGRGAGAWEGGGGV
jgi:hypothetical protein